MLEEITGAKRPVARSSQGFRLAELGPYRLHERLGVGGMATVYRARRIGVRGARDVALKRLHPLLVENESAVASFIREVRIARMLDHPVIRRVYSLYRQPDELFMTMEYVEGGSLCSVLKRASGARRRLPLRGVLTVLHRLCDALHHAHELVDGRRAPAGFVHRDISPSNLIASPDGQLKLIDMGVARANVGDLATNSGLIKGKYGYMAPEVLSSQPFDRRADVFSIGVLAWELLTVSKLYPVRDPPVDLDRIRGRPVEPPSSRNAACPPELDEIVLRALAPDPAERWATCAHMADAVQVVAGWMEEPLVDSAIAELAGVLDHPPVVGEPPRPRLARGTPAEPLLSPASPPVQITRPQIAAPAPRPHHRAFAWPSLVLGTVVGSVATMVGVALIGNTESDAAPPPHEAPVRAVGPAFATDAGVGTFDAALPPDSAMRIVLTVDESEVTRLEGPWPRSRSAAYRYRALLCIDEQGMVESAALLEGPGRLEVRIIQALLRWRYAPFERDDRAQPVCFELASEVQKMPRR